MIVLSLITFFVLIPLIRIRETVRGVRFALFSFVIIGFAITIPSLIQGNYGILMSSLIILANFIFATFINSPDVIGISGDPEDWFKHKVQIMIFLIYVCILLLYNFGFGWVYYQMSIDQANPDAFGYDYIERPSYLTFVYFGITTMSTVAFGEITPLSNAARLVISLHSIFGMIINVVFVAILLLYVSFSANIMNNRNENKIEREEKLIQQKVEEIEDEEKRIREYNNSNNDKYPNYMNGNNNL